MALITVRGRREPISISNERARKLKAHWLGLGDTPKSDQHDIVDLDTWSGEYGRIVEIEMTAEISASNPDDPSARIELQKKEAEEAWAKMTVEEKSKHLGRFKLLYLKAGHFHSKPDTDTLKKAEKIQFDYYKKNPTARSLPNHLYEPAMPKRKVEAPIDVAKMCLKCEIKPALPDSNYCSGVCQLAANNG